MSTWRAVLANPRAVAPLVPWLASTEPWIANTALLIGALLPPVSLMGFVCLAALVLRRSVQPYPYPLPLTPYPLPLTPYPYPYPYP